MSKLTFFQRIVLGCITFFVMIGFLFIFLGTRGPLGYLYDGFAYLRYGLLDAPTQSFVGLTDNFSNLWNAHEENEALRHELAKIKVNDAEKEELKERNKELEAMLGLELDENRFTKTYADVIFRDGTTWNNELIINKGSKHGIVIGMAVMNTKGLIGKVEKVSEGTSVVKLLTTRNKQNNVSIKIQLADQESVEGILEEYDEKEHCYRIRLYEDSNNLKEGQTVITSGKGGVYPSGLLVGEVKSIKELNDQIGKTIFVTPVDDFQTLDIVVVIGSKEG